MRESIPTSHPVQRGFSTIVAIFLLVILAALGVFIVSVTGLQRSAETLDLQGVRAYQAARAGVEWAAFQVLDPNNTLNPAPAASCSTMLPPSCPTSPTHISGLAGSLSTFVVSVQCTMTPTTEGNRNVYVFEVTATACNQPSSGSCIGVTPGNGYVGRQLTATLSKCKDSTATGPRCSCG